MPCHKVAASYQLNGMMLAQGSPNKEALGQSEGAWKRRMTIYWRCPPWRARAQRPWRRASAPAMDDPACCNNFRGAPWSGNELQPSCTLACLSCTFRQTVQPGMGGRQALVSRCTERGIATLQSIVPGMRCNDDSYQASSTRCCSSVLPRKNAHRLSSLRLLILNHKKALIVTA